MNTPFRYYQNFLEPSKPANVETSDADFYRFLSIPQGVEISVNDGPDVPLFLIPSYERKANESPIVRIRLTNKTTQTIVYRLIAGLGRIPPSFENEIKEPRTEAVGWSDTSLAAGADQDFVPLLSGMRTRRKHIIISNLDPSANLFLRDKTTPIPGNIAVIGGGEKMQFSISETVNLYNPGGAAVSCAVGEVYWLG
jgi:hypothetical protein